MISSYGQNIMWFLSGILTAQIHYTFMPSFDFFCDVMWWFSILDNYYSLRWGIKVMMYQSTVYHKWLICKTAGTYSFINFAFANVLLLLGG